LLSSQWLLQQLRSWPFQHWLWISPYGCTRPRLSRRGLFVCCCFMAARSAHTFSNCRHKKNPGYLETTGIV